MATRLIVVVEVEQPLGVIIIKCRNVQLKFCHGITRSIVWETCAAN